MNRPLGVKIISFVDCMLGIFVLGWFFKVSSYFTGALNALLSSCPCSILSKIAILVVLLLVVLLIKSGIQIFQLVPKCREDLFIFSSIGILILLVPFFFYKNIHVQGSVSSPSLFTPIICGSLILYLSWSIFYLNRPRVKGLFNLS